LAKLIADIATGQVVDAVDDGKILRQRLWPQGSRCPRCRQVTHEIAAVEQPLQGAFQLEDP